jgi:hypothetical protein
MSPEEWKEKRRFRRTPAAAAIEVFPVGPSVSEEPPILEAESLNLSPGGVLLSVDDEIPVGARVGLRLDIDSVYTLNVDWEAVDVDITGKRHKLGLVGKVVRTKGAPELGWEVAISFEDVEKNDLNSLQRMLEA